MTQDEITAEIDRLNALIRARQNRTCYTDNIAAINARVVELQAMTPE